MTPEERARQLIDVQDLKNVNPMASLGVAVREYPTSTGPVDYALFVDGKPVGVIEAKKDELGENITVVEGQSGRYANSTFKYITTEYKIRFAYEATGQLTRFTDYADVKYRSRRSTPPDSANARSQRSGTWMLPLRIIAPRRWCRWQPAQARLSQQSRQHTVC